MSWSKVFSNPLEPFAEVGTFEHEGAKFTAGGSFYDPQRGTLAGYPKKQAGGWLLTQWDGKPITPLTLVSTYRGGFGRATMYSWRAKYDGRTFSGRNSGEGMFVALRARGRR